MQRQFDHIAISSLYSVDCSWTAWSAWETCSVSCGGGSQERYRTINQTAINNGANCAGSDTETQHCNSNGCPGNVLYQSCKGSHRFRAKSSLNSVDCSWGGWSAWAACSLTCGGGSQERHRTINQPAINNGANCVGTDTETRHCNSNGCPGNVLYQSCKSNIITYLHLIQLTVPGVGGVHGQPVL